MLVFLCMIIYYRSKISLECLKGRNSRKVKFHLPRKPWCGNLMSALLKGAKQRSELDFGGKEINKMTAFNS